MTAAAEDTSEETETDDDDQGLFYDVEDYKEVRKRDLHFLNDLIKLKIDECKSYTVNAQVKGVLGGFF